MITDAQTNVVYFSDLLPKRCPMLYEHIHRILTDKDIDHRLLVNTKDIWCRDYMPIQVAGNHFVFYEYNPDYLQSPYYKRTITDVNHIEDFDRLRHGKITNLDLVIDGGNIVKCDDKIIMTEKIFTENQDKKQNDVIHMLEKAFQCDIVFLPWDSEEYLGHSDGIVHYIGNNQVLMTNYADFDTKMSHCFKDILEKYFEVIPLKYIVKRKHQRSWAYINFLQVGNLVLVPQLGIPEDDQAIQQISNALPQCKVFGIPALEAVRKGGALNCISWNVNTHDLSNGFIGDRRERHERLKRYFK